MIPAHSKLILTAGTAFHFSARPPDDVGSQRRLDSDDPDEVICAVLARLQRGDFQSLGRILQLMRASRLDWVWGHCAVLLSYCAPVTTLDALIGTFEAEIDAGDPVFIGWLTEILARSSILQMIPRILNLHRRMSSEDRLSQCGVIAPLSLMLEDQRGPIAQGPAEVLLNPGHEIWEDDDWSLDFESYENLILRSYASSPVGISVPTSPRDATAFWGGEIFDLKKVIAATLPKLWRNRDCELVYVARMRIEAFTGRSLAGFYHLDTGELDHIKAAALLEELLESGELDRFEPGARYFFGHRIPD